MFSAIENATIQQLLNSKHGGNNYPSVLVVITNACWTAVATWYWCLKTAMKWCSLCAVDSKSNRGWSEMAFMDIGAYIKRAMTDFLDLLMTQGTASAESKFLPLSRSEHGQL